MAFNVSYLLELKDRYSSNAQKIKRGMSDLTARTERLRVKLKQTGNAFKSFGSSMALKATAPIAALAAVSLSAFAKLETLQIAFESLTGSVGNAKKVVTELVNFTAKTPFQLEGVGKAAKQLLSFGVSQDALKSKLKFLGDIAAGANVPLSDMASIFGKVKAKGKAMTEEILQLSDRGIPIIDVIAKKFGIAKSQVFQFASEGKLSFDIIQKSLVSMTEKGGIFFNQMDKQSATLVGIWSTLKDNANLAFASIGAQIVKTLNLKENMKRFIGIMQSMTKSFNNFAETHPKLAKLAIAVAAIVAAVAPLAVVLGVAMTVLAAISAPILIAIAAFTAVGVAISALVVFWDDLVQAMRNVSDFWSSVFSTIINEISSKINMVSNAISSALNMARDFFDIGDSEMNVNQNMNIASKGAIAMQGRLDGSITVNAPAGVVQKIESKTSGTGFNLGLNMAGEL